VQDLRTTITTKRTFDLSTTYRDLHWLSSTPTEELSYVQLDSGIWRATRRSVTYTQDDDAISESGAKTRFFYAGAEETRTFEGPTFDPGNPQAAFEGSGVLSVTSTQRHLDMLLNPTQVTVTRSGGFVDTTTFDYANDTSKWLIARPSTITT